LVFVVVVQFTGSNTILFKKLKSLVVVVVVAVVVVAAEAVAVSVVAAQVIQ
jgi:hypothetical protein